MSEPRHLNHNLTHDVTYLLHRNVSSFIKSIAVRHLTKLTNINIFKVYVKHLIKLENNVNMCNFTVKFIQHFLCSVSVADFADTVIWRLDSYKWNVSVYRVFISCAYHVANARKNILWLTNGFFSIYRV